MERAEKHVHFTSRHASRDDMFVVCVRIEEPNAEVGKLSASWFSPDRRSSLNELPSVAVEQRGLRPFSSRLSSSAWPRRSCRSVLSVGSGERRVP